ncbi:MAG: hypothetical protein ACO20I_08930 [bacterium]
MNGSLIPSPPRMFPVAAELETAMDTGAIGFSRWFSRVMDHNGWSHPQLVSLCKRCTGDKAWLHSSQIAGLRQARLKSPGPRSFVALEYLFRAIHEYQKGGFTESGVTFGQMSGLVEKAEIMADENGNPATLGYLMEVFTGLREVPVDLSKSDFSDNQAVTLSTNAGRLVRKLMAMNELDPITDAGVVAANFSKNSELNFEFAALIKGSGEWRPEQVDANLGRLSHLLKDQFDYKRSAPELADLLQKM